MYVKMFPITDLTKCFTQTHTRSTNYNSFISKIHKRIHYHTYTKHAIGLVITTITIVITNEHKLVQ